MKKIYKKILLIIFCFIMIICSLSFINLSTNDNDVRYESNRRYSLVGTEVPNSGYVENVYVNINLSVYEVLSLLDSVVVQMDENEALYFVLNNLLTMPETEEEFLQVRSIQIVKDINLNYYFIQMVETPLFVYCDGVIEVDEYGFSGWNLDFVNPYNVNSIVYDNYLGMFEVGTQNDKITSLFSITPFTDNVEENTIINDLLSSIGLGITSIVGVVVNGIKESFLEFVYVDKDSDNLVVSDLAYFLFAMLGFSIAVGLIWLVIFMFKRRE